MSIYIYSEGTTSDGQVVDFTCNPKLETKCKQSLQQFRTIETRENHASNVSHGAYGRFSKFNLRQLEYAGGEAGYIEALEVMDGPPDKSRWLLHEENNSDAWFMEFTNEQAARLAFKKTWGGTVSRTDEWRVSLGGLRFVNCGPVPPWFYATTGQTIMGDYAVPRWHQDDPVFTVGTRVLHDRLPKTVVASRAGPERREVYFDDGTEWSGGFLVPELVTKANKWKIELYRVMLERVESGTGETSIRLADGGCIKLAVLPTAGKLNIQQFCYAGDDENSREKFRHLFRCGEFTFATDRCIIVRVPAATIDAKPGTVKVERLCDWDAEFSDDHKWKPLPKWIKKDGETRIGVVTIRNRYLAMIASLPNAAIRHDTKPEQFVPFRFDGGCGLVMPLKQKE